MSESATVERPRDRRARRLNLASVAGETREPVKGEREPDRARVGAPRTVAARGWFWISESSPKPLPVFAKPTLPLSAIKMSNSPCERARASDRRRARQRGRRGRSPRRRTHALDDVEVVADVTLLDELVARAAIDAHHRADAVRELVRVESGEEDVRDQRLRARGERVTRSRVRARAARRLTCLSISVVCASFSYTLSWKFGSAPASCSGLMPWPTRFL